MKKECPLCVDKMPYLVIYDQRVTWIPSYVFAWKKVFFSSIVSEIISQPLKVIRPFCRPKFEAP